MSGLLMRRAAVLAKIETTYGTDPTPAGATDAILVSDLTPRPMDMQTVDRALLRPFLGSSEQLPAQIYNGVEFSVELAGSGTAGNVPPIGPLLRACGFAQTVDEEEDEVIYEPVSDLFESVTLHVNLDGVLHRALGARGTVTFSLRLNERPMARFNFTGIFVPITDATMPSVNLGAWQKPLPVTRVNTPVFSLHSYAGKLEDLQLDVGNQVVYRGLVGGNEEVRITQRAVTGSIVMEAVKVADKDWWTAIRNAVTAPLILEHGTVAGNIVRIEGPQTQVHTPRYQDSDGIAMLAASLALPPSGTGNDELRLIFK